MVVSLIGTTDNELVQRVLMVAAFAGVPLKLVPIREGVDNCTEAYRLNCHPLQLVPVMKTGEGYLFEANAMVRYLARIEVPLSQLVSESVRYPHPQYPIPYTLYGHSLLEVAQIDNWLDFVAYRIDPLTLPLLQQQQQQQQQRAQFSPRSLSSTNTSTALRSGRAGNTSQTIQVTIRVDATTKQELWRHMTYLENTLQHLREQRKQWLKEMSAPPTQAISNNNTAQDNTNNISATARTSSYADAELLREEELSILIARGRQSQLGALYNVASAVRDRHEEQDKAAKEEQLEDIRRQTELLDENQEGNGTEKIGRRTSTSALSPRLSSVSMGRDTLASGVGTSLVGLQQQQQQQHAYTARASYTPRSSRLGVASTLQRYDFVFLVGETLTAADIVVADGLHHFFGLLQNTNNNTSESAAWRAETTSTFPQCYKYYKSVMMLPIATDMRRALHVSIVGV